MSLPRFIRFHRGSCCPVIVRDPRFMLSAGWYREELPEIVLRADADRRRVEETLLHEILHGCEQQMVRDGVLKQESTEAYVEHLSVYLYRTLDASGLWDRGHNLEFDFCAEEENP